MLLSSCSIGKGIADFGNNVANQPPVSFGASRRVAVGHYVSPLVDPWDDRGPVIIAFEYKPDGPHLAMRPLDGSSGCDTGLAYASVVRDKLDNRMQLVAYQDGAGPQDCRGTVHFVDHNCKEYGSPIPNASLPDLLYSDPPGYLINAAAVCSLDSNNKPFVSSTQLLVVDPWNGASTVLAGNITWSKVLSRDELSVAAIDGGHYKIFNAQRQVTTDIGTAVTEIAFLSGTDGGFALVDGGTLRTYKSVSDSAPVEIAKDACQPNPDSGGCLFYFSPCSGSGRKLQCYRADTGQSMPIDTDVSGPLASHVTSGSPDLSVIYTKSDANGSNLWLYTSGASPSQIVGNFSRLYSWSPPPNLEVISLVNADADTGQLVRHTPTADAVLADSVSVKFSQGLLANFDPNTSIGDLYSPPQLGQTPQFTLAGVPYVKDRNSIVTPTNPDSIPYGTAIIANAQSPIGDLTFLRYPSQSAPGPESPRMIASGVSPGGFKFFDSMNALAFTENWSAALTTGTLIVHELDLDARTKVSDEVREFQEVQWPAEGIMYIVPSGDRQGIWVAKAK